MDFFGLDLSKMDQTCSNRISQQSKNVSIQSCHIYKLDKNGHFIFDQIGSDLSKMDQYGSNFLTWKTTRLVNAGLEDKVVDEAFVPDLGLAKEGVVLVDLVVVEYYVFVT